MHLKEKVKKLPSSPGVYLMKDSLGNIIYVGKAKKLKVRVQSYFQDSKHHSPKVKKLVKLIDDFEVIHTDTEFEAFILENQFIKKIKPLFNSRMKTPQTYPYITIRKENKIREIRVTNQPALSSDSSTLIFGPYTSKSTVETALNGLKDYYKINCKNAKQGNSACLNYSLGTCLGICLGGAAIDQYERIIDEIISILKGNDRSIIKEMKQKMKLASEGLDFESATKYRDYISAIQHLIRSKRIGTLVKKTKQIVILEPLGAQAGKLFLIRGNQIVFKEIIDLDAFSLEQLKAKILNYLLAYFKRDRGKTAYMLKQAQLDEAQIIDSYLNSNHCHHLIIPRKWLNIDHFEKLETAVDGWLIQLINMVKN